MTDDRPPIPFEPMRRRDRAVEDAAWIEDLLDRAPVGVLATSPDRHPFANSNLFVYDRATRCVYLHTARVGQTREAVAANARCAFTVFELGRLLPATTALEFSAEFASVVAFGEGAIVDDPVEATRALELMLVKYAPHLEAGNDYRAPVAEELKRTSVFRMRVETWSGKQKTVSADFPGAYRYRHPGGLAADPVGGAPAVEDDADP